MASFKVLKKAEPQARDSAFIYYFEKGLAVINNIYPKTWTTRFLNS